ncbi:hypothetical protein EF879_17475 [Micromonospora sp. HM5-17]|nr:hypothetical protein EF879_17475 [Micromonospora sp. HM5-17]
MRAGSRAVRAAQVIALAALAVALTQASATATDRSAPPAMERVRLAPAPAGELLVVQANLQDAVRPADVADQTDLDNFARRLVRTVPAAPDALLLTEVTGPGAERVALALKIATGYRYAARVAPGRAVFADDASVRESAIVVNLDTVRPDGAGGFHQIQGEDQAYLPISKPGTPPALLVSGHAAGDPAVATDELVAFVDALPGDRLPVLGADLRNARCAQAGPRQPIGCEPQRFWTAMADTRGYVDVFFEHGANPAGWRSSYLFTRASVAAAAVDSGYPAELEDAEACKVAFDRGSSRRAPRECRQRYYADQPFGWARLVRPEPVSVALVPGRVVLNECELGVRSQDMLARLTNRTAEPQHRTVTATAAAPLAVTVTSESLEVPAGQARGALLRVTAEAEAPPGEYEITVTVGDREYRVPVTVPEDCVEPPAVATSWHVGNEPERAVDGDSYTFWHSEWTPPNPLPQSITVSLGELRQIQTLHYQPRQDGNLNGTILDYTIEVSVDGRNFTTVAQGSWPANALTKTLTFPATQARYLRITATRASGGSYASAAEITVS